MHLRTVVGTVELTVWQGPDPRDPHGGIPIREAWGLSAHQQMSVALPDKLAFTATLAGKWGCAVDGAGRPLPDNRLVLAEKVVLAGH